ncbi:hypothetical protein RI367_004941 [Sorochytrium milnesiophthora]
MVRFDPAFQQARQFAQQSSTSDGDQLARTADSVLQSIETDDPRLSRSEFMEFMRKLRDREVVAEGNKMVHNMQPGGLWADEFEQQMHVDERGQMWVCDIGASLLYMLSNNIGQIAYLNAQAHGLQRIYFGGYFIRGHPITMNTLSYAINYWSRGTAEALFLRHEGYLGAIGAFLKYDNAPAQLPARSRRYSVSEHFVQWDVQAGGDTAANESSSS